VVVEQFRGLMAAAVAAVARAPEGGVLIHCAAGKDRTGLVSAMLLGTVGVPAATIADDYALTAELLRSRDLEWLENGPGERAEREAMLARFTPTAQVMLEVLDQLGERYGGVEPYLLAGGVSRGDLARLRERLLAPQGG
jgi:protein-tyrosine phosphatase